MAITGTTTTSGVCQNQGGLVIHGMDAGSTVPGPARN
jgi:hypothetical protein